MFLDGSRSKSSFFESKVKSVGIHITDIIKNTTTENNFRIL